MSNYLKFTCSPQKEEDEDFFPTQKIISVLVGTFSVMFIGIGTVFIEEKGDITQGGASLAWGAIVMGNIYMFGHISGAHINPALTISLAMVGRFPRKQVSIYVIAELLGSLIASVLLKLLFSEMDANLMLTLPLGPNPVSGQKVVALEIIISFMYALAICSSTADPREPKNLGGVSMGAVVFVIMLFAGKITGASMNPARSIGPAIVANNFTKIWMYLLSSFIGAISATSLYFLYLRPETVNVEIKQDIGRKPLSSAEILPTKMGESFKREVQGGGMVA